MFKTPQIKMLRLSIYSSKASINLSQLCMRLARSHLRWLTRIWAWRGTKSNRFTPALKYMNRVAISPCHRRPAIKTKEKWDTHYSILDRRPISHLIRCNKHCSMCRGPERIANSWVTSMVLKTHRPRVDLMIRRHQRHVRRVSSLFRPMRSSSEKFK